jgi:dCTP deaminase
MDYLMTILSGQTIRALGLLEPCLDKGRQNGMSYGLSHAGYDLRIKEDLVLFPGQFRLASTLEKFIMPNNVVGIMHDKSTWARRGLAVQNTVAEPGWTGYLTLELTNHGNKELIIDAGDPICQVLFHFTDLPCIGYDGKYQNQETGAQPARFD